MKTMKLTASAAAAAALLGVCATASAAQYANVISATPVTATVSVPTQSCTDVERVVQPQPSGAGALIGAIAGGVLGNQFGHGFGRAAATGLGVVAGSSIGNQVEASNNPPVAVAGRDCRTVGQLQSRVVGYDVVYEYNGQRYTTRTAADPGPHLAIDVRPQGGYADAPPPAYGSAPAYVEAPAPAYYAAPAPAYYPPAYAPAYYYGAPAYYGPAIGLGIGVGYGYGWHHGYRRW